MGYVTWVTDKCSSLVEEIARLASERSLLVAAAESLTSGSIATCLGAGPDASTWFAGSVVAYHESVKFDVLGVDKGPVCTESCARQMALGAARLLSADAAVSVTGVGGPGAQEGLPSGSVFIAATIRGRVRHGEFHFDGDPPEVIRASTEAALSMLAQQLARVASWRGSAATTS
jgi:nicotinamide-nucleotide amidase